MRNTAKIETVYTYAEWCKLVDRHGKQMLKKYIKSKLKKVARLFFRAVVIYLVYALCYAIAFQFNI